AGPDPSASRATRQFRIGGASSVRRDSLRGVLANAEFELPTMIRIGAHAPQLEYSQLGDSRMESDRDIRILDVGRRRQRRFERIRLAVFILGPGADQVARAILLSSRRTEKAKYPLLADDQADFAPRNIGLGSFFHSKRHDAKRPERPWSAGNRQPSRFDTDI